MQYNEECMFSLPTLLSYEMLTLKETIISMVNDIIVFYCLIFILLHQLNLSDYFYHSNYGHFREMTLW